MNTTRHEAYKAKLKELSQHTARLSATPGEPDAEALSTFTRLVFEVEQLRQESLAVPAAPAGAELAVGFWGDDWCGRHPDEG